MINHSMHMISVNCWIWKMPFYFIYQLKRQQTATMFCLWDFFSGVFCFSDFLSYHENELGITKLVYILGPSKIGVVYLFQCNCEVKTKDFLKLKKLTKWCINKIIWIRYNRIEEIISIIYLPYIHHLWYLKIFAGYLKQLC